MGRTYTVQIPATGGLKQLREALLSNDGGAVMAQVWFYDNGDVVLECGVVPKKTAARIHKATSKRKAILWPLQVE